MKKLLLFIVCLNPSVNALNHEHLGRIIQGAGGFLIAEAIGRFLRDKNDINRLLATSKSGLQKSGGAQAYDWGVGALRSLPQIHSLTKWVDLIHAAITRKYYNLNAGNRKKYLRGMRRLTKRQKRIVQKNVSSLRKIALERMVGQVLLGGGLAGLGYISHRGRAHDRLPVYLGSGFLTVTGLLTDLIASTLLRHKYKSLVQKILKKGKRKHHPADNAVPSDDDEDLDDLDALEKELALVELEGEG